MLAKVVMQCEKNSDPTGLKIVQSELGIKVFVSNLDPITTLNMPYTEV